MTDGWNQVHINLADFCEQAYGSIYLETLKVQIHGNCRLRRVYFSDKLYEESELPPEFRLFVDMDHKDDKKFVEPAKSER